MVDHVAALWRCPEPAEGGAAVPRCVHLANTFAGVSLVDRWRAGRQERECVAPERCTRERGRQTVPMHMAALVDGGRAVVDGGAGGHSASHGSRALTRPGAA